MIKKLPENKNISPYYTPTPVNRMQKISHVEKIRIKLYQIASNCVRVLVQFDGMGYMKYLNEQMMADDLYIPPKKIKEILE